MWLCWGPELGSEGEEGRVPRAGHPGLESQAMWPGPQTKNKQTFPLSDERVCWASSDELAEGPLVPGQPLHFCSFLKGLILGKLALLLLGFKCLVFEGTNTFF